MQEVVFLRQHTGGRLAADMLWGLCILRERTTCPLYRRISGVFHKKSDPDFPPKILRSENASAEHILQIPLLQGVLCDDKKSPVRGPDGAMNQNWGGSFRSAIRLSRREFNSLLISVFINCISPFWRPPASKRVGVNLICTPCVIKSHLNKTRGPS